MVQLSRLVGELVRAHHVVVFVIENVAMPHIARADGGVEGERSASGRHEVEAVASHISRPHNRRVLQPRLVDRRWHRRSRETRPWLSIWDAYVAIAGVQPAFATRVNLPNHPQNQSRVYDVLESCCTV